MPVRDILAKLSSLVKSSDLIILRSGAWLSLFTRFPDHQIPYLPLKKVSPWMALSPKLQTDEEEVLIANRTFYTALHTLDISLMAQVWLHTDWVKCLHPGWDLLVGWDEVRGSWEEIIRSTEQMMVSISRPLVHVVGDVAWVSCLENVTTAYQKDFSSALVEATNIFVRRQGRWLMVHHHTTPLAEPPPDASAPVQ